MGNSVQKLNLTSGDSIEEPQELVSDFTCEICVEPVGFSKKFKNKNKCSHPFCSDCIGKHIQAKVQEYNLSEIKCPGLNCAEILDPLTCSSILEAAVFERWCDALCESWLQRYERVYCPHSDCSALILNECKERVRKTKCPQCKKLFCFKCKTPWHAGYRCNETRVMRDENDVLLGQLMEDKKWKRCPVCNHGVELRSGCPIVRCRCGTCFCYACGSKRSNNWCWCRRGIWTNQQFINVLCGVIIICCVILLIHIQSLMKKRR